MERDVKDIYPVLQEFSQRWNFTVEQKPLQRGMRWSFLWLGDLMQVITGLFPVILCAWGIIAVLVVFYFFVVGIPFALWLVPFFLVGQIVSTGILVYRVRRRAKAETALYSITGISQSDFQEGAGAYIDFKSVTAQRVHLKTETGFWVLSRRGFPPVLIY